MPDESIYRAVQDEAAHYDENPDGDEWEPVPAPATSPAASRRHLRAVLSVRFAPEELDRIKAEADREGVTVSTYVRSVTLGSIAPTSQRSTRVETSNSSSEVVFNSNYGLAATYSEAHLRRKNSGLVGIS